MFRLALAALLSWSAPPVPRPPAARPDTAAMEALVADLCRRDVALLGEASHGDGRTFEFKTELIRRLVDECGYDAVFFESSHYDFLEFSRRLSAGEPVTPEMLSSSIGGIWNRHREVQPLIRFLFAKAKAGDLKLGGIDDQLGSAGAFFSIKEMPERLTSRLAGERRAECRETIRRRIYSDYGPAAPYGEPERVRVRQCLREVRRSAGGAGSESGRSDQLQMLDNIERYVARDFADEAIRMGGRDRSMYLNFRWLAGRLPPRSKIIVWSATAHIARDAAAAPAFAGVANFGSFVHRAYGRRAFSLGFSAWTGSYRDIFMPMPRDLGIAAPDSIESRALERTDSNIVYRDADWLKRAGSIPGGIFSHRIATADWGKALDGLIIFRAEYPPQPAT